MIRDFFFYSWILNILLLVSIILLIAAFPYKNQKERLPVNDVVLSESHYEFKINDYYQFKSSKNIKNYNWLRANGGEDIDSLNFCVSYGGFGQVLFHKLLTE